MKVDGSLASLVQGVSQQPPNQRRPGQHAGQVNMMSDPVRGLSRRHGTIWQAEQQLAVSAANAAANDTDSASYRSFDYTTGGRDLTILYRSAARAAGADLPPVLVYDKTNSQWLTVNRNVTDTLLDALTTGGVSALCAVGQYVFMAGNTITPAGSSTNVWADATNQGQTVLWVRGGAYSRTYKATVTKTDNSQVSFSYTTPAASYGGTLDTSTVPVFAADPAGGTQADTEAAHITAIDVGGGSFVYRAELGWQAWTPTVFSAKKGSTAMTNTHPAWPTTNLQYKWDSANPQYIYFHSSNFGAPDVSMTYTHVKTIANPNYAKAVADITNAFNTAVTNWIGTAASAIQPENIAQSLTAAATTAGLTGVTRVGSTVVFTSVKDITFSDSGDGTLLRGCANTVQAVADLTDAHFVGKTVRISPSGGESFYMKATAKNPSITSGVTEVLWVEGAGISRSITSAFVYGVANGSNFYLAGSATLLNAIYAGTHPTFESSTVGDDDSSPMPHFVGRKINYLGVFQDRLLVGSEAVLRASKVGDYLNFFRGSVLTVAADDPLEFLSQGSEDDVLRYGVLYDRDLLLFGKRQYAVSGRTPLTPTSANMPVVSSHEGADDAQPRAAGGLIFYAKQGAGSTSVHQIEPGRNAESPESYPSSSQLDDYILGNPAELTVVPKPSTLLVRSSGARHSLFVYSYHDTQDKRLQDAWHRWDYAEALGHTLGTSVVRDGVLVFMLRTGLDSAGVQRSWAVADLQPMASGTSSRPYLDSNRVHSSVVSSPGSMHVNLSDTGRAVAFDGSTSTRFIGDVPSEAAALNTELPGGVLIMGYTFDSTWTPTNPLMRDDQDKAINTGRLVVTSLLLSFKDSSGFTSTVTAGEVSTVFTFNGRFVGDVSNVIGETPVSTGKQSAVIGRDTAEYTQVIASRNWLPLNITAADWTGQLFHRPRRT
jgi:hypothetical protein